MSVRLKPMLICAAALAAVLFLSARCVGQNVKTAEPTKGSITGRVLNSAGEPLVGASVYAGSIADPRRSQTVKVNENGNFKVDGLSAGLYRVWASSPGYVPSVQSNPSASNFYHIGDTANFTLNKGAVITGKISGPNGPMITVGVFAIRVRDEEDKRLPTPVIARERATDDRGIYRIYGLSPGTYLIMAARARVGMIGPSAYDNDTPTYFPSSPRDTASEITVREGDEVTADIQYRAEPGHAISGQVAGVVESQGPISGNATVTLIDVRNRLATFSVGTSSYDNFKFALSGIPDGEYELFAFQFLQSRDDLRSKPRRILLRGADVSGVTLTVAKQAAIEGRVLFESDPKLECGKREETARQETIVYGRRYEPEKGSDKNAAPAQPDVSLPMSNYVALDVGDAKGTFRLRNLPPGTYRIDPRAPGDGWYLRSISTGLSISDSVSVRLGEAVSGLTVTFAEGAGALRGSVAPKGDRLPKSTYVYLVPAEKENATTVFRYFEARLRGDGSFSIDNIAPGEYFIVALKPDNDAPSSSAIAIRQNLTLRNTVVREAEKLKQKLSVKPCERLENYDLTFTSPSNP